jgi:cyanobactin maturation PatA/PatG family protease
MWTLNLDATPIYAILPAGAFVDQVYERLREFLDDQVNQRSEIVSVPGYVSGSVTLYSGQTVPVVIPEVRGLFDWSVASQVERALGPREEPASTAAEPEPPDRGIRRDRLEGFISRVYFELRNLGLSGPDRALNYSATNLFQLLAAIDSARTAGRNEFRSFTVTKSPVCRADSECYDVKIRFMDPDNVLRSSFVVYFTIDVSDVMPVTIGVPRQWFEG